MKAIKLTFLLIVSMSLSAVNAAEGYLTDSMVWTYGYLDTYSIFPSITNKSVNSLKGDTVFNSMVYRKVMGEYGYVGAIREEGKKWFAILRYFGTSEVLLYDFSAKLGDTINHIVEKDYFRKKSVVTKVDSITLENGTVRKRMVLDNYETWIDGIGDTRSIFAPVEPVPTWNCMPRCVDCISPQSMLVCFKQKGIVLYSDQTYCTDCCAYKGPEGLEQVNRFKGLRCLLNSDGMLDYQLTDGPQIINNAKLLNLSGTTIWEARTGFGESGGRISIGHLPHGIYLLRVSTVRGVVMEKVSL